MSPSPAINKKILKTLLLLGILGNVAFASALTISPARMELNADPGNVIGDKFILINEQENEQTFYTSVENFEAQGETGTPNFISSKEGLSSWVNVIDKIVLKKGEKKEVTFTVNVPNNADAGGHFAAIFLSTVPPSAKNGEVSVGAKVGMLILLRVSGEIKESGGILGFGLKNGGRFVSTLPVTFVYRFNNAGNDRVNPVGEISIRNTFGFETEKLQANEGQGNILPGSTRKFEVRWGKEEALKDSAGFFEKAFYEMRNFAFGAYTAKMSLNFGTSGQAKESVTFFVLPWHFMSLLLVLIIVLLGAFRSFVKKYNSWIIKQAQIGMSK